MEYTNGQKETWRFWVWKRLRSRLRVHPRFATVVFLAGPSPEDLHAAKVNGFRIENIVAIDVDEDAVNAARRAGCTAIQGDIHDVVNHWDDGVIDGCVADYCCGLTFRMFKSASHLASLVDGPTVLNFQRGRESDEQSMRMRQFLYGKGVSKHRGEQFAFMNAALLTSYKWYAENLLNEFTPDVGRALSEIPQEAFFETLSFVNEKMKPLFYSYISNVVKMDTVLITDASCADRPISRALRSNVKESMQIMDQIDKAVLREFSKEERDFIKTTKELDAMSRRMIAAKAVRTMNGALKRKASEN